MGTLLFFIVIIEESEIDGRSKIKRKKKGKTKVKFWGEIPAPGTTSSPQLQNGRGQRGLHVPACPAAFELQVPACHIYIIYSAM